MPFQHTRSLNKSFWCVLFRNVVQRTIEIATNLFRNAGSNAGDPNILGTAEMSLNFCFYDVKQIFYRASTETAERISSPLIVTSYFSSIIAMRERAIREDHSSRSWNTVSALISLASVSSNYSAKFWMNSLSSTLNEFKD